MADIQQIDMDNQEMQYALQIIQYTRNSLFLTGKAGTGKSTLLRYIATHIKKKKVILAPTGIAAINAGGSTLHSFFKLPFHPLLPTDSRYNTRNIREALKYNSEKRKLLQELELIIIDEISMVRADIIDFIDKVLRIYCHNMREPFGGKQLLLVGDVYQLEPVVKEDERQLLRPFYQSNYFFHAHIFMSYQLVSIELRKVYRQQDAQFVALLDNIRTNHTTQRDLLMLNQQVTTALQNDTDEDDGDMSITLSARRDTVDFINQSKLEQLPDEKRTFVGEVKGEFPETSLPTPIELELKLGAQILFIRNDKEHRWVNGTLGTIIGFDENAEGKQTIFVHTDLDTDVEVEREIWSNVRYSFNETDKKIEEEEIGTYVQYPLRLAWAITVHKSQGLTFNHVKIDFTGGVFAGGQAYVALSRCTSLEGLKLQRPLQRSDIFVRQEVVDFAQQYNNKHILDQALQHSRADYLYHEASVAFDKGDIATCLKNFFQAIHLRYDIEQPAIRRLIQRKLGHFRTERQQYILQLEEKENELQALKQRLQDQENHLKEFALEYYMMGKDCEAEGFREAAIRNYEKALRLYDDLPTVKRRMKKLKK